MSPRAQVQSVIPTAREVAVDKRPTSPEMAEEADIIQELVALQRQMRFTRKLDGVVAVAVLWASWRTRIEMSIIIAAPIAAYYAATKLLTR